MAIIIKKTGGKITGGVSPYLQDDTTNYKPISFNGGTNNVETILFGDRVVYMSKSITIEAALWDVINTPTLLYKSKGEYDFTINTPFGGHVWGEIKDNNGVYLSGIPENNFDSGQQHVSAKGDYGIPTVIYPLHLHIYLTIYMNKEKTLKKVITFGNVNGNTSHGKFTATKRLNYGYWNDTEDITNTKLVEGTFTNKIINVKLFDKITTTCSNTAFSFTSSIESSGKVTVYRNNAGSKINTSLTVNNLEAGKRLYYKIVYGDKTTTGSIYNSSTLSANFTISDSWSIPANTYVYTTGASNTNNVVAVKIYYSFDNSNWYGGNDIFGKKTTACASVNTISSSNEYNDNRYISSANLTASLPTINISGLYARYYASDGTNNKNYTGWVELSTVESTQQKLILSGLDIKTWGIYIEYSTGKTAKISEIYLGDIKHDSTTTETTTIDIEPFD